MPLLATITFPPPMLKDNDFFAPLLRRNLGFDPHVSNDWRTNRHLCTLSDKLHIGQCDCVANGTREFFYINRVAWAHSILPTARRHNRIHILSFSLKSKCTLSCAVPSLEALCQTRRYLSYTKVGGERTTCRGGLSSGAASWRIALLHLAHGPHSVYSNL